ncbi:unnamed protein product [Diatraea saccharalis]|uniref:Uncharacterized protein n=1 Tax=Diatraea saccharalis TaxID=40085 RepID=A0A9N9WDE1_9NEOP|nr:unnamed protein product [Diatraea saccharalis]
MEEKIEETKNETKEKIDTIDWEIHEEEIVKGLVKEIKEGLLSDRGEQKMHQPCKEETTYANMTKKYLPETVHSIILTSEDKNDTAEDLIQKANKILDPKTGNIKIDKIRKIKDQKIIIGCKQENEINKIKEKLEEGKGITIEKIENKNPLIVIKDVQYKLQDEELTQLIINQNKEYFKKEEDKEMRIKFKKIAINQERCHAVIQVKPEVWGAMTRAGRVSKTNRRSSSVRNAWALVMARNFARKVRADAATVGNRISGQTARKEKQADHHGAATPRTLEWKVKSIMPLARSVGYERSGSTWPALPRLMPKTKIHKTENIYIQAQIKNKTKHTTTQNKHNKKQRYKNEIHAYRHNEYTNMGMEQIKHKNTNTLK